MRHFLLLLACFLVLAAPVTAASVDFAGALNALASGKSPLDTLQITVQGFGSPHMVTIYGDGVVIDNQDSQRAITQKQVKELVKDLRDAGFAGMPDSFGSAHLAPGMMRAIRLIGSLSVTIAGVAKDVTQIGGGEQSQELAALAHQIQDVCSASGEAKTASNLADGLDKLGRGELAPETFSLMIHRVVEQGATADDPSWLLRIQGRVVEYAGGTRTLSSVEFAQLIHLLTASGAASFPNRLYAPHYTDYEFHVLNQQCSGQARENFSGIDPTTQGDAQKSWEQLFVTLGTFYKTGHLP